MNNKAIITSALPYANGEIHLGHVASTYLPADVTTRFLKQKGVEAYYICASDDFGTPILIQSEKEGKTPSQYVKHWNARDAEDFAAFDIDFDYFSGTSSAQNISFVQAIFKKLQSAGHIYESEIIQFFCKRDDKFLPDRYVKGVCPHCNTPDQYSDLCESCGRIPEQISDPKCSICGNPPIKKKTTHYFFKLKNFAKDLDNWLGENNNLQKDVKKYVQNWIKTGLIDWDITRDISWGVPIPVTTPNDNSTSNNPTTSPKQNPQVFYGWFDNHLAYISSTLKFLEQKGINGKKFWNSADIYHFIGKDIVYHHYLFLPAMRLGISQEYKLPDYIPTRGHLTLESKKISKSRNWYIGLRDFLGYYPADYLRYYLISINPYSQDDLNFDWEDFATRINSELIGNLGNFVNRALGFTHKNLGGVVPPPLSTLDELDNTTTKKIQDLSKTLDNLLQQNHLDRALRKILDFTGHLNQYFQHKEPWKKNNDIRNNDDPPNANTCIYLSVNAVRSISVALYPFLPNSSQKIWEQLGLDGTSAAQSWDSISELCIRPKHKIGSPSPLFAKIESADIKKHKQKLLSNKQ